MIGILSDSHDNIPNIRVAVRLFKDAGCDLVVHAGDVVAPFAARELAALGCPVKAVYGNCDGEKAGLAAALEPFGFIHQAPLVFEHGGRRILVTHLNRPAVEFAAKHTYDVVIFGHTHKPDIRRDGKTLLVNPGETGGWVTGRSTIALYDPAADDASIVTVA
jgi:putative phosphoesterase